MARCRLTRPCPCLRQQRKVRLPISKDPGQLKDVSGVMIPSSRAAAATMSLYVEPGGYWPAMARVSMGCRGFE